MDPWGTPYLTVSRAEAMFLKDTICFLSES